MRFASSRERALNTERMSDATSNLTAAFITNVCAFCWRCIWQRCHVTLGSVTSRAAMRPSWLSLTISLTPCMLRSTRLERALRPWTSFSLTSLSTARMARCPSSKTPATMNVAAETTTPPTRTLWVGRVHEEHLHGADRAVAPVLQLRVQFPHGPRDLARGDVDVAELPEGRLDLPRRDALDVHVSVTATLSVRSLHAPRSRLFE